MIVGYFDYIIIGVLIFLNIKFWKKELDGKIGCLLGGFLFGFILPVISMIIEIQLVESTKGILDNFEILYTYLKFPTYWLIGFIQLIVIGVKYGNKKSKEKLDKE